MHTLFALEDMYGLKIKEVDGEITKEECDNWRYKYPELDTSKHWAKVPSQALSDFFYKRLERDRKRREEE